VAADIGRSRRGRTYIVVGTVLAVLAFATAAGVASIPLLFPAGSSGAKVVVAKVAIAARTKIQASDLMTTVITPVPPQSFSDVNSVAGKGARVDIPAGAPVTANLIAQSPDLLSSSDTIYLRRRSASAATFSLATASLCWQRSTRRSSGSIPGRRS